MNGAGAAGEAGAVEDILEPEAGGMPEGVFGVEAFAVVADADAQLAREPGEADVYTGGARVLEAVLKTFLDDPEEDELAVVFDAIILAFGGHGDVNVAGTGDALHLFVDGGADIEGEDMAGVHALGEIAELLQRAANVLPRGVEEMEIDVLFFLEAAELYRGEAKQLADVVMDLFGEIGEGLFLYLETGLGKLLVENGLHLAFFACGLSSPVVVIAQHREEEDAEEKQDDDHCQDGGYYLLL